MSNKNIDISIIIVNWNGKKWLKKCLSSLRQQTIQNYEILLFDNASTDGSVDYIKKYFPEVKLIESDKNLGFAKANNIAVNKASSEHVLFLNNDTYLDSNVLEKYWNLYINNKFDAIGLSARDYFDKSEKYIERIPSADIFGHFFDFPYTSKNMNKLFTLPGYCFLINKRAFNFVGGFDDDFFMYSEELDLFWRLILLGKKIYFSNDLFIYHAKGGSSTQNLSYNKFLWNNTNNLQMILKNYSLLSLLFIIPIYFLINFVEVIFFILLRKPEISFTYLMAMKNCWNNRKNIIRKRRWIQSHRVVSDLEIIAKLYIGSGKIKHLIAERYKLNKAV